MFVDFIEELMNKTKEVHRLVEELSTSALLLVVKANTIAGAIRSIEEFIPLLINRIQVIPNITFEAEQVLETIPRQCKQYKFHPPKMIPFLFIEFSHRH